MARKQTEADRYRHAAELAIGQLDWCINYLQRIRKPQIAGAIRRNRDAIVKRLQS